MGKYSPITLVVVHFSHINLHRLASGDINILSLYLTSDLEGLASDPVSIIRCSAQDLLVDACICTTNLARLPTLVNHMTFSWRAKNGTQRRIRNEIHLTTALENCITNNTPEHVIYGHCDLLYFDPNFTGLDLNQVDTSPIPLAPHPVATATTLSTTTTIGTLPSVTPPTDIFNYHALPTEVMKHFDAFQDPNIILRVQDMTPFSFPDGSQHNYYTNPAVIGSHVILCNGAVLKARRDQKQFSRDVLICSDDSPAKL
jgi:hypothetical protein